METSFDNSEEGVDFEMHDVNYYPLQAHHYPVYQEYYIDSEPDYEDGAYDYEGQWYLENAEEPWWGFDDYSYTYDAPHHYL